MVRNWRRSTAVAVKVLLNPVQGQLPQPSEAFQAASALTPRGGGTCRSNSNDGEMNMRPTGHIRQRSAGSFEIRYSLGTDPATGKRRMATTTVKGNRRAAEKELRRLLRTLDTGEHVDPSAMTVREWLTTWLDAVHAEVAPKSHERYSEIVRHFLLPALGNLPLAKLAPSHIQQAYNGWAA